MGVSVGLADDKLEVAHSDALDSLASALGISRDYGETDESFRTRAVAVFQRDVIQRPNTGRPRRRVAGSRYEGIVNTDEPWRSKFSQEIPF